ncbi:hypothetical protein TOT_020000076 [Theileria orientalis strain Shintoku]|uniref:Uncharacterized protein n=1 Tax=Theileria orientalis strain Shintoku TaxID=869250 RepID=J4D6X6_THEOR|nr:hypothetical protein TOT_020000076 [Theileria orientalis strain Shintoku]BAM39805.1 hypothetical protein TOT_020000076 [Theileria orientalis strain Shintoku]|eukprot:XP_009690106.1 hypothetical protein TOT_020000076 [Theileria orientalis strain Shintoku]
MASFDIHILSHKELRDKKFTYNSTNGKLIDVIIREDTFRGYVYQYHSPKRVGPYKLNSVRMDSVNQNLDFDVHLPLDNVCGFFVFYKINNEKDPLLICIQRIYSNHHISYRYFCPRDKNRQSWMLLPDLVVDPKWSSNRLEIKNKLEEQITLMNGVIIELKNTAQYKYENIHINLSHIKLNGYDVYTHEVPSQEPFHLKQVNFKSTPLKINDINDCQIIAVHAFGKKDSYPFEPISVCVVKYQKNKANDYEWYSRSNIKSNEWKPDSNVSEFFEGDFIKKYINELYDQLYEIDFEIDNDFFYHREPSSLTAKGIRGKITSHSSSQSRFKVYNYELSESRTFKIKSLTINNQEQIISQIKAYSKFHIVCDDRHDKDYPLFMCFPDSHTTYQWYRRRHYASDCWVKCEELKTWNPESYINDHILETAYSKLFWIDIDIDYVKRMDLQDYNRNNRYIGKRSFLRDNYTMIETVNYNSYPFYVRIVEKGEPLKSVIDNERVFTVCVLYDPTNKPRFIVYEYAEGHREFVWYSKNKDSDVWIKNETLKDKDPKDNSYRLNEPGSEQVFIEIDKEQEEKTKTITAQALGTTVGTAACCGLGYFIYTNVSSFGNMISNFNMNK